MLHVRQEKTTHPIVVLLRADAKEILVTKYRMRMPRMSQGNFNLYVKEVVRLAGIDEPVKFNHTRGNKLIEEVRPNMLGLRHIRHEGRFVLTKTWLEHQLN